MKIYRAMIGDADGLPQLGRSARQVGVRTLDRLPHNDDVATPLNRAKTAWATGDPLVLHREVERLAAEGHSRQELEDALAALMLVVCATGAGDDAEEIINGVWDRLTGWCHADQHIGTLSVKNQGASVDAPVDDKISTPLSTPSTIR